LENNSLSKTKFLQNNLKLIIIEKENKEKAVKNLEGLPAKIREKEEIISKKKKERQEQLDQLGDELLSLY